MADVPPLRRPSDDVAELQQQLLRELEGIQRDGDSWSEPSLYRAYLQHAQAMAWQRVADGDLNAPRDILDHLLAAQSCVDAHPSAPVGLAAQAATEVHHVLRSLYLADQVLEESRTKARLADRDRSRTEREILRILFENRGTYQRRGAIRARMDHADRPTPSRVGQILVDLHEEGLILRTHGRAQGNPSAAFYALSPRGSELCRSLGLTDVKPRSEWIGEILSKIFESKNSSERRILIDLLSTCSDLSVGDLVIEALEKRIEEEKVEARLRLYKEILLAVLLARRTLDFAASTAMGPKGRDSRLGKGLYILEAESNLPAEKIVNAYIESLEPEMAQDGLINVLLKERGRLSSERFPASAPYA